MQKNANKKQELEHERGERQKKFQNLKHKHKYTKENLKTYGTKKSQKIYKKIRKKIIKNYKKNTFLK